MSVSAARSCSMAVTDNQHVDALCTCSDDVTDKTKNRGTDEEPSSTKYVGQTTDESKANGETGCPRDADPNDVW